jgi:hypothetical protein
VLLDQLRPGSGRHHADDRADQQRVRPDRANLAHPGDIGRGLAVGEDRAEVLADLFAGRLAPVEADRDPVGGEQLGEGIRVAHVPGLDQARVQVAGGGVRFGVDARYATTSR